LAFRQHGRCADAAGLEKWRSAQAWFGLRQFRCFAI
jgi:hypothetical protein